MFSLRGDNEIVFRKNRGIGVLFCVSKTRGVSSPFICYRFGKISKYIFTTGYANVTAYKKRACSPPNMADPAKRKFYRKTARHHSAADFHAPALHRTGSYPAAGGRGTQSGPRKKAISPYWEQSINKNSLILNRKDMKNGRVQTEIY